MARGGQLTRQWRLLQLIDRPQGITVGDAARDLRCTVRTVWRDLVVLQEAGFPVFDDRASDGRRSVWRLDEAFKAGLPLKLTLAELAALLMSRDLLAPAVASALGPAMATALDKVRRVLSRDALALLDAMRDTLGVRGLRAKLQPASDADVAQIQTALLERRGLRLRYYSMHRDEITDREVDPYHLTHFESGLYLVAHCHLRNAVRIFAVDRMRRVDLLRRRFERPAGFDVDRYLAGAWGIVQGDLVTVKVVFAAPLARYIRERLWHPSQAFRDLDGGRLEMTLRVADTTEVRRWILGHGVHAEVIAPASLRDAIRAEAEALARRLAPQRIPPTAMRLTRRSDSRGTSRSAPR